MKIKKVYTGYIPDKAPEKVALPAKDAFHNIEDKFEPFDYVNPISINKKALEGLKNTLDIDKEELTGTSTNALLLSSVKDIGLAASKYAPVLGVVGGVGSLGMLMTSGDKLTQKGWGDQKIQAVSDLSWGVQSGITIGAQALSSTALWTSPTATSVGVLGGSLQTYLGAKKLYEGIKDEKTDNIVQGTLNTCAGGCWILASTSVAPPITGGSFIGLTLISQLYGKRNKIKEKVRKAITPDFDLKPLLEHSHSFPKVHLKKSSKKSPPAMKFNSLDTEWIIPSRKTVAKTRH